MVTIAPAEQSDHRVIVCGSCDADNWSKPFALICGFLDRYHAEHPITLLGHGAARGVDSIAEHWAKTREVPYLGCPARWTAWGRKAGPIRNSALVKLVQPQVCLAFPCGDGTADMVRKCRAFRAEIVEVER